MKRLFNHIGLYIASFTLVFAVSSCDPGDFGDLNDNPNATTVPVTSALLTNAISGIGAPAANTTTGSYAQYFSETQYPGVSLYTANVVAWDGVYAGVLYDLQNIIDNNTNPETAPLVAINGSNNNQLAVARILKAFRYMYLTDQYGDIPYSAALKGDAQPIYDTQEAIYTDLFKELKEAVAQFDSGLPAKGDILFNGNITQWKKFANSLRLILALRVSDAKPDIGKAEFTSALAANGGVIESNADNAQLNFPGGAFKNPWFALYDGRSDWAISDVVVGVLKDLGDSRLQAFGQPNSSNDVVPVPYGVPREDVIAYTNAHPDYGLVLNAVHRTITAPQFLLTAAHVFLARAEAAQRGWTSENVNAMYEAGIKASFEQWGVFNGGAYEAYITNPKVSLASGDALAKIGVQRWLAFYPDGTQGWSEWRRTGFPNLKPTPFALNTSKQIPRRYVYPATEPNLNGVNFQAAVTRLGGDSADTKVWWDK
ncbi:MAG: SusD/RagB family nutrient-binding outer membrane lipoprotein [Saprospiraceae bacterium]